MIYDSIDITAGNDFLGLCDQNSLYKHVSYIELLRSYGRLKLSVIENKWDKIINKHNTF